MAYQFTNTEINNEKASDYETKSLLYLVGMRADSDYIDIITVDCFNDVNGANEAFDRIIDIQSKNHAAFGPAKIGESLYTLYENYISSIDFQEYILFCKPLKDDYLIDKDLNYFGFDNIISKTKTGIINKLSSIIKDKNNVENPPFFDEFLSCVKFYQDTHNKSHYIKSIAKFKNKSMIRTSVYENIFKEIRDKQTALKNSYIENKVINHPIEVLDFNRHITKSQIFTIIISKLVGLEVFEQFGIPIPLYPLISNLQDQDDIEDLILECKSNLSRAFFDKNSAIHIWVIVEIIIKKVQIDKIKSIAEISEEIYTSVNIIPVYFDEMTINYLIALVISGSKNVN